MDRTEFKNHLNLINSKPTYNFRPNRLRPFVTIQLELFTLYWEKSSVVNHRVLNSYHYGSIKFSIIKKNQIFI